MSLCKAQLRWSRKKEQNFDTLNDKAWPLTIDGLDILARYTTWQDSNVFRHIRSKGSHAKVLAHWLIPDPSVCLQGTCLDVVSSLFKQGWIPEAPTTLTHARFTLRLSSGGTANTPGIKLYPHWRAQPRILAPDVSSLDRGLVMLVLLGGQPSLPPRESKLSLLTAIIKQNKLVNSDASECC